MKINKPQRQKFAPLVSDDSSSHLQPLICKLASVKFWRAGKQLLLVLAVFLIAVPALLIRSEKKLSVAGHKFKIELADGEEKRQSGLSGRDNFCNDCAMLFLFPDAGQHVFWMKGMKFSLDIIWVSKNNKIIHIEKNVSSKFNGTVNPPVMADKVIEINAKLSDEYGFKIGDEVIIE